MMRFHLISHELGEHAVGFNYPDDLQAQRAEHGGVHGDFPQMLGVHLAKLGQQRGSATVCALGRRAIPVSCKPWQAVAVF